MTEDIQAIFDKQIFDTAIIGSIKTGTHNALILSNNDSGAMLYHQNRRCGDVCIEDICGDLSTLLHTPVCVSKNVYFDFGTDVSPVQLAHILTSEKGRVTVKWSSSSAGFFHADVNCARVKILSRTDTAVRVEYIDVWDMITEREITILKYLHVG